MIKILHYIPAFGYGGIEKLVINLYKNIDKKKFQFDFLVECEVPQYAAVVIKKNGGKIIRIPKMTNFGTFFKYLSCLRDVFSACDYDVFHCHSLQTRPFPMLFAKKYKIKMRILHVHANNFNDNKFYLFKKAMMLFGQHNSNFFVSCSSRAAKSMLTKRNQASVIVLNNGIITDEYVFSNDTRKNIRGKLGIAADTRLVACIGRLSYLKNQKYVIDIFNGLPSKYMLLLLGDGEDKVKLEALAKNKNIIFLGNVDNVNDFLCASDLIVMPSISEAMPLTVVEIQSNGVPAVVSFAVDNEFVINKNVVRVKLDDKEKWLDLIKKNNIRVDSLNPIIVKKYDIVNVAKIYEDIIARFINNEN